MLELELFSFRVSSAGSFGKLTERVSLAMPVVRTQGTITGWITNVAYFLLFVVDKQACAVNKITERKWQMCLWKSFT